MSFPLSLSNSVQFPIAALTSRSLAPTATATEADGDAGGDRDDDDDDGNTHRNGVNDPYANDVRQLDTPVYVEGKQCRRRVTSSGNVDIVPDSLRVPDNDVNSPSFLVRRPDCSLTQPSVVI